MDWLLASLLVVSQFLCLACFFYLIRRAISDARVNLDNHPLYPSDLPEYKPLLPEHVDRC